MYLLTFTLLHHLSNIHFRALITVVELEIVERSDTMLSVHVWPLEGVERSGEAELVLFDDVSRVSEAELEG